MSKCITETEKNDKEIDNKKPKEVYTEIDDKWYYDIESSMWEYQLGVPKMVQKGREMRYREIISSKIYRKMKDADKSILDVANIIKNNSNFEITYDRLVKIMAGDESITVLEAILIGEVIGMNLGDFLHYND